MTLPTIFLQQSANSFRTTFLKSQATLINAKLGVKHGKVHLQYLWIRL